MKINWGNTWIGFLLVLCIIGVGLLITVFVGDKTPKKYYLESDMYRKLTIKIDLNYQTDGFVYLPDTMQPFTAVRLVDSLNATLK